MSRENVILVVCHASRLRHFRCCAGTRHRWTLGIDVLPHGVSVYTQFPGDPTNGQSLALPLLNRLPSRRLKWGGLSGSRSHSLANCLRRHYGQHRRRSLSASSIAPVTTTASSSLVLTPLVWRLGTAVCTVLVSKLRRILGRGGASWEATIRPSCCTASRPSSPSKHSPPPIRHSSVDPYQVAAVGCASGTSPCCPCQLCACTSDIGPCPGTFPAPGLDRRCPRAATAHQSVH